MTGETRPGDQDNARTRYLNDRLRVHGEGGVILVSLALLVGGRRTVTKVLRAVAADHPTAELHDRGALECAGLPIIWQIVRGAGVNSQPPLLSVMLAGEASVPCQ